MMQLTTTLKKGVVALNYEILKKRWSEWWHGYNNGAGAVGGFVDVLADIADCGGEVKQGDSSQH